MDNLAIEWKHPGLLALTYRQHWVWHFTNRWSVNEGSGSSYVVEVRLVPPTGDKLVLPPRLRF